MTQPQGVHLVGSINFPDAETTMRETASILGARLKRIPDGETGERLNWINFQKGRLATVDGLHLDGPAPEAGPDFRRLKLDDGADASALVLPPLGYSDAALESWAIFDRLRDAGEIPAGTRFQVSLPTPASVIGAWVAADSKKAFEPVYAAALFAELDTILAAIPHDSLSIQWDTAVEFGFIEKAGYGGPFGAWFDDIWAGVIERAAEQASRIPADVELGFHFCYGDAGEQHFFQPVDMANLVKFASLLFAASPRRIDFLHLPVPIERDDDAYFLPLDSFALPADTELYLGLIHREDGVEGANRRAETAARHHPAFGVSTECGFGRTAAEFTVPLLEAQREVAAAW